jgi:tetratricopeptide (TPR) repeat protein
MTIRCDCCGTVSDLDESFTITRKSLRRKKTAYCPQCWAERELESNKSWIWFYGLFLLIIIVLWLFDSKEAPRLFGIFLFVVFLSAVIIPHELGHAIVARILGLHVFMVVVGSGRTLKKFQLFGFSWEFKQFPLYGFTVCCVKSAKLYRLKRMLVTLAGPAVNLGLIAAALFAYGSLRMIRSWSIPFMPFACFAFANLWMLIVNLVPRYYKTVHGKLPSDGLSLLRLPFSSKADIDQNIVFYYALEGLELRKKGQLNAAIQWYQKALSRYPGDTRLLNDYAVALIDCERFDEAKALCNQIIEKQEPDPGIMAIVHNNIAYLNILLGEKTLLEEADASSSHAFANWPWIPAIKGTRGMVLVELGRIDEGIRLLKEALDRNERARDKALSAAYLAVAEARKGNRIRAQQYLETATQYHSDHPLIERAKDELFNQNF